MEKMGTEESELQAWTSRSTAVAVSVVLIQLLYICYKQMWRKTSSMRLPPGPRPWPVIGNLHLLAQGGKLPHQALMSLAQEYGPLMSLKLGSHTVVVASNATMAEEILKTQNHLFASRPQTAAGEIMSYHRQNLVWAPYGDQLKNLRKIVQTQLVSNQRIKSFQNVRDEEVLTSVQMILEDCNNGTVPIVLYDKLSQLSTNNVSRMIFGKSFFGRNSGLVSQSKKFMTMVQGVFRLTGAFVVGDFIPALKRFDIQGYEAQMKKLAKEADELYSNILDEHRRPRSQTTLKGNSEDFVDILLSLSPAEALSDEAMKAVMADLLLAGTDTSANQGCWSFAELMRRPEILSELQQELDSVIGRERLVTEEDIPNLPYLQAVVKESFRLHPVAVLLPYESTEDAYIEGYFIPAKSRIFVNNYAISRDPATWDNPLDFNPDRFMNSKRDVKGHDFDLLPFGAGRRKCIGMNVGLIMLQFTLAQLLHTCMWSLPQGFGTHDVDLTEDPGISVPLKTPLKLVASPRLPLSVIYPK